MVKVRRFNLGEYCTLKDWLKAKGINQLVFARVWRRVDASSNYYGNHKRRMLTFLEDLIRNGAAHYHYPSHESAMNVVFFYTYVNEIGEFLLKDMSESNVGVVQMFRDFDRTDMFFRKEPNQVLMARYGFEEAAKELMGILENM